jgi:uncharacterized protein DUF5906/uncharacterized protein DUF3854
VVANFPININPLSELLEKRHLTASEGTLMGLVITSPEGSYNDLGYTPYRPGIKHLEKLPYFDLAGAPIIDPKLGREFVRYRIERPEGWVAPANPDLDFNGKPKKPPKYLSPKGSSIFVYVPRTDAFPWEQIAADPTVPVMITEGEFKSYAVCKAGFPCLGLQGVQCFGKNADPFPAPFDQFEHLKRHYYIVFDADKESTEDEPLKREVHQAATRLATKLGIAGATIEMLRIARTDTFKKAREKDLDCKMGVDDFLEAGGTLDELMATHAPIAECEDMIALRSKYVFYTGTKPHIINVFNGNHYLCSSFVKELEAPRVRMNTRKNGTLEKIKVAQEFIDSRDRPEVDTKVFWPSEPPGYDAEARTYNEWTGFGTEPLIVEADEDKAFYNLVVGEFKKFIKGLFEEHDEYHLKWAGHMIQCPGEKTSIAMLIASVHNGIGKSLLGEIYRGVIGERHSVALEMDRTVAKFNILLGKKLFLQMDEADGRFSGNESKIKDLISSDKFPVEPKGIDTYMVDNFVRVLMTSNSSAPIRLDAENRRFFVAGPTMTSRYAKETWQPWVNSIAKLLKSPKGLRAIHLFLSKIDLSGWDPMARVLVTPQMEEMVNASRTKSSTVMDSIYEAFLQDDDGILFVTGEIRAKDAKLWTDVIERVRIEGGATMLYDGSYQGKKVKGTILDRDGKLPSKQNTQKKWILDSGSGFTGEHAFKAGVKTSHIYDACRDNALPDRSKKY